MRKQKGIGLLLLLVIMLVVMAGCGKAKKTQAESKTNPTFTIDGNNCFTVAYEEEFKEDYYDKKELESLIDSELAEFNETYAVDKSNGVVRESFSVKDGKAVLKLRFSSAQDYMNYSSNYVNSTRNARLFIGTYDEAVNAGYSFGGTFHAADGSEGFDAANVKDEEKVFVLFTNEKYRIGVSGEIIGMNSNVSLEDKLAVTSDKQENYIIYKLK